MGSLSGILQRPVVAAAAVTVASFYGDLVDKFSAIRTSEDGSHVEQSYSFFSDVQEGTSFGKTLASSLSNTSFVAKIRVPLPDVNLPGHHLSRERLHNLVGSSGASCSLLLNVYRAAELAKGRKMNKHAKHIATASSASQDALYRWHLPDPDTIDLFGSSDGCAEKSRTVVVLLGWLGSKQRHLKKYAEWYTSKGFHVITFTFPMSEILSYQVGGKAEQDIEQLVEHLIDWLEGEQGKNLVFHTFSNTGWLIYGAMLENFGKKDPSAIGRIKGCIVDSAPVAAPDPQVWASGFSAAFLKKHSVATKGHSNTTKFDIKMASERTNEPKPAATEAALLILLEKFFSVILNLPSVNRRLGDVLGLLSSHQPSCPQMYIYSSADKVIPADSVESFIEKQKKAGHVVRSCNFVDTPHVDHFRNNPKLYTSQVSQFLDEFVLSKNLG